MTPEEILLTDPLEPCVDVRQKPHGNWFAVLTLRGWLGSGSRMMASRVPIITVALTWQPSLPVHGLEELCAVATRDPMSLFSTGYRFSGFKSPKTV